MQNKKREQLAARVLQACRNQLYFDLRFMERALFQLEPESQELITLGGNGKKLYYNQQYLLMRYYESSDSVACDYLHLVVHCLFWHPFDANKALRKFWDLASDIAAAEVIRELAVPYLSAQLPADCFPIIEKMRKRVPLLSAVKIAMHLQEVYQEFNQLYGISFEEAEQVFCRDCHDCWYSNGKQKDEFQDPYLQSPKNSQIEAEWKEIVESVVMEANHFSKQHGHISGDMIQQIQKLTRENYNYTEFLRKFAVLEEVMKLDTDSFDLIYYNYGMRIFGNVPLIEPLEYKEECRIREFVIAIDTSGSCSGELVQRFLNKTYNILKQTENFSNKVLIHVIQCDAEVQKDYKIEALDDLEALVSKMQLYGFGGTDFRPVFKHVDELCKAGEFKRLCGLIYFTDGYGVFPKKPPAYKTAFVFVNREDSVTVPPWAMKVYLEEGIEI